MRRIISFLVLFLWIIGVVVQSQNLTTTMMPTAQPTPQCNTFEIEVDRWNDTGNYSSLFEGYFEKTTELAHDRPVWQVRTDTNRRLYFLSTSWVIETVLGSGDYDYLIYADSDENFPPIGTEEWTHGSHVHAALVTTKCIETFLPSAVPTSMPSKTPSDDPTNSPTDRPTTSPSNMPSNNPSSSPTNNPTVLPTPECSIIGLSVNYSSVLYVMGNETVSSINRNGNTSEEIAVMNMNGWIFWPTDDSISSNGYPQWLLSDSNGIVDGDTYSAVLYYDEIYMWTLNVTIIESGEIIMFVDTSESNRKIPFLTSDWITDTIIAEFSFNCYGSWYPSSMPSNVPTTDPTFEPSLAPSGMPTETTLMPTYAPTYLCNELYLDITDINFEFDESIEDSGYGFKYANDTFIFAGINGTYYPQSNLVNNRPWYQYEANPNIWIEWSDGAWYLYNPTETVLTSLQLLYYVSGDKEPPMDAYSDPVTEASGYNWLSTEAYDGEDETDDDFKEFRLYIRCKEVTNQPTSSPTDMSTTSEMVMEDTTSTEGPSSTEEEDKITDDDDPTYIGLTLIEWFVLIFLLFLCCICIIGVWWYREYKKAKILESEKNKKLTANKNDEIDENELFGASHRAYAANSPPNQPTVSNQGSLEMGGRKSKMSYVSEGDDDVQAGTSAPQAGSFENALQLATSHKSQAPI